MIDLLEVCSFDAYMLGPKKDIEELNKAFLFSINPNKCGDFMRKRLKPYEKERGKYKHFFGINYFYTGGINGVSDTFYSQGSGECQSSLKYCMRNDIDAPSKYRIAKKEIPENEFMGTTLEEFAEKHPDLTFVLVSDTFYEEDNFKEYYCFKGGKLVFERTDFYNEDRSTTIFFRKGFNETMKVITEEEFYKQIYEILNGEYDIKYINSLDIKSVDFLSVVHCA